MRKFSYQNEFDLHEIEPVGRTYFHINRFARLLVYLTQTQKTTRKWRTVTSLMHMFYILAPHRLHVFASSFDWFT